MVQFVFECTFSAWFAWIIVWELPDACFNFKMYSMQQNLLLFVLTLLFYHINSRTIKMDNFLSVYVCTNKQRFRDQPVYLHMGLTLCLLVKSADNVRKQFGSRSGQTKCRAWSGSKLFDALVFPKAFFENSVFEKKLNHPMTKNYTKLPSMH